MMDIDARIVSQHAKREGQHLLQFAFVSAGVLLLVLACAWSLWGLVSLSRDPLTDTRETYGEYLIALVLSVEGLVAIAHLSASKAQERTEILRQLMDKLSSEEVLQDAQFLREKLSSLRLNPYDVFDPPLTWTRKTEKRDSRTVYAVQLDANNPLDVVVDMNDRTWACINRVIERYHAAGLLFAHRHLPRDEFLNWAFLPVVRMHSRLIELVRAERVRRGSPELWQYFEELAWHANKKRRRVQAGEPSRHGIAS